MSSKKLVFYGVVGSPPCRTVLLTLKALGLDFDFHVVDMAKGEHLQPEYLAKNPQHTIPVLEDDGVMIWDSHAIAAYLVRKYGKDDSLYPKDFQQRAICDQRLHFETGMIYALVKDILRPLLYGNSSEIPQDKVEKVHEVYKLLETFLAKNDYMVGDSLTIADLSIVSTVSTLHLGVAPIDGSTYPKLKAWFKRLESLPYYEEANGKGVQGLANMIHSKTGKQYENRWQKAAALAKSASKPE